MKTTDSNLTRHTMPDGTTLFGLPGSSAELRFIHREIFAQRCYSQGGIVIRDGNVIVDVGANVGLFSIYSASQASGLRILAFEPLPPIFAALQANLDAIDSADHQLECIPFGLSSRSQTITMSYFPSMPGNSTVHFADKLAEASSVSQAFRMRDVWELDKLAWAALMVAYPFRRTIVKHVLKRRFNRAEQVEVNLRRLSDVLREKNVDQIDLLKIDVEGAEFEVLDGLEPADWERVRQLVMEIAPANVTKIHAFAQDLQQRGFTSVSVIDAFGNSIQPTPHQQHNGLPMILCARCL